MENQFKKGDRVLVRDSEEEKWRFGLYFRYTEEAPYKHEVYTVKTFQRECIPFEGHEDLVGTCNDPNEKKDAKKGYTPGQQLYDAETDETVIFVGYNPDGTVKTASVCVGYRNCNPHVLSED